MWDDFIESFEKREYKDKRVLKNSNQYLSDVINVPECTGEFIIDKCSYIEALVKSIDWSEYDELE